MCPGDAGALRRYAGDISVAKVCKMREHFGIGKKRRAFQHWTSHGIRKQKMTPAKIYSHNFRLSYVFYITKKDTQLSVFSDSGDVLLSRAVAHQVSSALRSLTTVFGMGTGVTSLLSSPNSSQSIFR